MDSISDWVNTSAIRSGQLYDLNESRLETEDLNRQIAKEKMAMAQAEAQRKADAIRQQQAQAAAFMQAMGGGAPSGPQMDEAELAEHLQAEMAQGATGGGMPVQDPTSTEPSGAPGGAPAPGGPGGPPPMGAPSGGPAMAPAGLMPGEQGGIPTAAAGSMGVAPMQVWAQSNPIAAQGMGMALATGDGEGYRKYLTQYQDWVKQDQFTDPYSIPGEKGLFKRNLLTNEVSKIGGGGVEVNLPPGEKKYAEESGKGASARREEYLTQGAQAQSQVQGYHRMYQNVMTANAAGAFGEARVGLARLGKFLDMPEDWVQAVSGLSKHEVGKYEELRSQSMDIMFQRIRDTKGAISNREMELFKQASPGIHNTRQGNILLVELLMETEARKIKYDQFIRSRTRGNNNTQANLEDAEFDWNKKFSDNPEMFNDAWHQRKDRILGTHDRALDRLMKHRDNPKEQRLFYQVYGWLPRGIDVPKGAVYKGAR